MNPCQKRPENKSNIIFPGFFLILSMVNGDEYADTEEYGDINDDEMLNHTYYYYDPELGNIY